MVGVGEGRVMVMVMDDLEEAGGRCNLQQEYIQGRRVAATPENVEGKALLAIHRCRNIPVDEHADEVHDA